MGKPLRKIDKADKTAEIQIPDNLKKSSVGDHTKLHLLVEERRHLDQKLKATPVAPKVDDRAQIEALEKRKRTIEREFLEILERKNAHGREDLKKATQELVNQTQKLLPVEDTLEKVLVYIHGVKTELQLFFEKGMLERQGWKDTLDSATKILHENRALLDQEAQQRTELQHLMTGHKSELHLIGSEIKNMGQSVLRMNQEALDEGQKSIDGIKRQVELCVVASENLAKLKLEQDQRVSELRELERKEQELIDRVHKLGLEWHQRESELGEISQALKEKELYLEIITKELSENTSKNDLLQLEVLEKEIRVEEMQKNLKRLEIRRDRTLIEEKQIREQHEQLVQAQSEVQAPEQVVENLNLEIPDSPISAEELSWSEKVKRTLLG